MKIPLSIALLAAFASQAAGTCCCVVSAMHRFGNGDALCLCRRYETGDCEPNQPGQCQWPTNVTEYRLKGHWETPEYCPNCQPIGVGGMSMIGDGQSAGATAAEAPKEPITPIKPEGVPVADDFDPTATISAPIPYQRLPLDSKATLVGYFKLKLKNKVATNIESDTTATVVRDSDVKLFRVSLPSVTEDQFIAYEVINPNGSAKEIPSKNIVKVRYSSIDGDRVLTLQIAAPNHPQLNGKSVYLLRGPQP
jgi:hypothetical protein